MKQTDSLNTRHRLCCGDKLAVFFLASIFRSPSFSFIAVLLIEVFVVFKFSIENVSNNFFISLDNSSRQSEVCWPLLLGFCCLEKMAYKLFHLISIAFVSLV